MVRSQSKVKLEPPDPWWLLRGGGGGVPEGGSAGGQDTMGLLNLGVSKEQERAPHILPEFRVQESRSREAGGPQASRPRAVRKGTGCRHRTMTGEFSGHSEND